ncbi:MAG TPA: ABC transporter ATP-binding protein [Clostridia bacterium]|nr:ABC transporter ATP-binding protein [Clostridia bacterium]
MNIEDKKDFFVVNNISKWYLQRKSTRHILDRAGNQWVKAVDGISFSLGEGEILGVIGESGCGKSTLGRILVRLEDPTSGDIHINGVPASAILKNDPKKFRRTVQIVFQNPFDTFSPRHTIGETLVRTLKLHDIGNNEEEQYAMCKAALANASLSPPEDYLSRYPYELSGGQLQRISILKAMLLEPPFIVADEPVSMLDVSVRADIINMLQELSRKNNSSMVFISHDIATTRYISNRVMVMYLGRVVEMGYTDEVVQAPRHPYTRALISNCASIDPNEIKQPIAISGEPPTPVNAGPGCYFAPRCYAAGAECFKSYPAVQDIGGGHFISCHNI